MRPGSIVVCLKVTLSPGHPLIPSIKWLPAMDEKTPYIIRSIYPCKSTGVDGIRFEEGIIGYGILGTELGFPITHIREILPPGEIPEEIKEIIDQELLVPLNI